MSKTSECIKSTLMMCLQSKQEVGMKMLSSNLDLAVISEGNHGSSEQQRTGLSDISSNEVCIDR